MLRGAARQAALMLPPLRRLAALRDPGGTVSPTPLPDPAFDYSQYGEQPIVLDYFSRRPDAPRYCVDAGAHDGVVGSNSRALFLTGWGGVAIEPDPRTFARLAKLYADRQDVRCVRRALSDRRGWQRMQFSQGPPGTKPEDQWMYSQVNTFSAAFAEHNKKDHNYRYRSAWVAITTLTRVLRHVGAPQDIGFMSIDCEGEDVRIIKELDFRAFRPRLLCLECLDEHRKEFSEILAASDFTYYAHTAANTLFERPR